MASSSRTGSYTSTPTVSEEDGEIYIKEEDTSLDFGEIPVHDPLDYPHFMTRLAEDFNLRAEALRNVSHGEQGQEVPNGDVSRDQNPRYRERERPSQNLSSPESGQRRSRSPRHRRQNSHAALFFPETLATRDNIHTDENGTLSRENEKCICPISVSCPNKGNDKLDCRPLVPRFKKWISNPNTIWHTTDASLEYPHTALIAERERLAEIVEYINVFFEYPASHEYHSRNYDSMTEWATEMHQRNVSRDDLDATEVLLALEKIVSANEYTVFLRKRKQMPELINEELTIIYRKWNRGDYDCNPKRGLFLKYIIDEFGERKSIRYALNKRWEHYVPAHYLGAGGLVNGQVWYSRVEMQRDGVHTHHIAGICGTEEKGAYALVMGFHKPSTKEYYADIDEGDVIEYLGTARRDPEDLDLEDSNLKDRDMNTRLAAEDIERTRCTRIMETSLKTGMPVRVIRSCALAPIIPHRPQEGYRYDGLYKVTGKKLLKEQSQIWSFTLCREPGQGKIRGIDASIERAKEKGYPEPIISSTSTTRGSTADGSTNLGADGRIPVREGWNL